MKKILLSIFLLFSLLGFSQNFEKIVSDKLCECITQDNKGTLEEVITKCASQDIIVKAISEDYEKRNIKIASDSISKIAREFDCTGNVGMMMNMMASCDSFISLFYKNKEETRLKLREIKTRAYLDSLNSRSSIIRESLVFRSKLNFAYDNYDLAKKDLEKVMRLYTASYDDYINLAWIYEKKKEYTKALEIYNILAQTKAGKELVTPLINFLKRKMSKEK
ncbi:tetratricopeptide repeat protein [Pseudotenacibaculum sp. MALMAid0570]|uniref:tetratricopeptide repeat protein n=1 Tax=Pseudotenacibaculum sp. MALMAid0570 TaxID=3143938 RepID=UPI0032DFCBD1